MKTTVQFLLAIFATGILFSCESTLKVTSDYDKGVNFAQYKTFAIEPLSERDQSISDLNRDRILAAIKAELIKKGFTEADTNTADMKILPITVMTAKKDVTANTNYYGYGGVYRPYSWGSGSTSAYTTYDVNDYIDGSLIIDVVDERTNKLVWEGVGNKEIDSPKSKDPDVVIPEVVGKILANFPPGAGKKK